MQLQGRVYDVSKRTPLEAVAVLTNTGKGTITDSTGRFTINVRETDTIFFSYQGKSTNKFAVADVTEPLNFEVSIHVIANELPGVTVKTRNYLLDSIENRKDYAKVFNYRKPTLSVVKDHGYTPGGVGVGFDLGAIIGMFQFRKNRVMLAFQKRLVQQEQDKYIDKRFSRRTVFKITGLKSPTIDSFMTFYRPGYEFVQTVNDLELGYYISECYKHYKRVRRGELIPPPRQEAVPLKPTSAFENVDHD
jgi:hypothetical protein